ncbi:NAD(P)/FAD-dependent oxidoreductase [Nocardioides sp. 31GB23]|uniref:NAD(P)/FAD-dependent oxidoreductase n=1 Tax=Nocardioides sp. 31GB23 TaxID=3156065 RepID=UPI0032AECDD0
MSADPRIADLVVIGGGPSGLACAGAAAALGLRTVVVEGTALGGELNTMSWVDGLVPHRDRVAGPDLSADLIEAVLDARVHVEHAQAEMLAVMDGRWSINNGSVNGAALVLATGREYDLEAVPGAAVLHGRGVSTCSSCDGPMFKNKNVIVLGAGRDAVSKVRDLTGLAASVAVLPRAALTRADRTLLDPIGVDVRPPASDVRLAPGDNGTIVLTDGAGVELARCDGVFLAGSRRPRRELLSALDAEEDIAIPFRACVGDLRPGSSQTVVAAVGDGVDAAWAAMRALELA